MKLDHWAAIADWNCKEEEEEDCYHWINYEDCCHEKDCKDCCYEENCENCCHNW